MRPHRRRWPRDTIEVYNLMLDIPLHIVALGATLDPNARARQTLRAIAEAFDAAKSNPMAVKAMAADLVARAGDLSDAVVSAQPEPVKPTKK